MKASEAKEGTVGSELIVNSSEPILSLINKAVFLRYFIEVL
jgi:hypothetical protein